jgi:hypothetical protein
MQGRGYCECGCGEKTSLARVTDRAKGHVKGQPVRFLVGHAARKYTGPEYVVDPDTGCWVWQHAISSGYGKLRIGSTGMHRAHRVYYERLVGPIPEGLHLDHLCRNRACVNPDHLEPVTNGENTLRGDRTKLTWEQVGEIRAATGTHREIALKYGVHRVTIGDIRAGRQRRVA